MLIPKKVKHRKWQRGRSQGRQKETRGLSLAYGQFGLKSLELFLLTSAQIEAARRAITGSLDRRGRLWIRIFPDRPITRKPPEVTMGNGKGAVDHYVAPVKPGRMIFEIDGVDEETAYTALKLAAYKLPVKTKFVNRNQ